jgi:hypothetical protein
MGDWSLVSAHPRAPILTRLRPEPSKFRYVRESDGVFGLRVSHPLHDLTDYTDKVVVLHRASGPEPLHSINQRWPSFEAAMSTPRALPQATSVDHPWTFNIVNTRFAETQPSLGVPRSLDCAQLRSGTRCRCLESSGFGSPMAHSSVSFEPSPAAGRARSVRRRAEPGLIHRCHAGRKAGAPSDDEKPAEASSVSSGRPRGRCGCLRRR